MSSSESHANSFPRRVSGNFLRVLEQRLLFRPPTLMWTKPSWGPRWNHPGRLSFTMVSWPRNTKGELQTVAPIVERFCSFIYPNRHRRGGTRRISGQKVDLTPTIKMWNLILEPESQLVILDENGRDFNQINSIFRSKSLRSIFKMKGRV